MVSLGMMYIVKDIYIYTVYEEDLVWVVVGAFQGSRCPTISFPIFLGTKQYDWLQKYVFFTRRGLHYNRDFSGESFEPGFK